MPDAAHRILQLIKQGEGPTLEFKEVRHGLGNDVYRTVCAFLNRHGGTLLLGISDKGEIKGIPPEQSGQIKRDFASVMNNPQKINPACYLTIDEAEVEGEIVLRIYVPESSQVHRCGGRIYDRNEEGDFDITDNTQMVAALYRRKQTTYSENKIFPYAALTDLREDLIKRVRKIVGIQRKDHPWVQLEDLDLLKSAQLYQTDMETGKSGITLAGILLLGKDQTILSVLPHHRTDLILRKVNLDRYDDRDDVRTNLIESYERIMAFAAKHLPDPFYLERDQRISIRDAIFREVASNILIHREYTNPFPAKLVIGQGRVWTENSNNPRGFGHIDPENFAPMPKNPNIAKFFREIGRADELGSGVRNLMKYGKAYGKKDPELIEGDIFRTIVYVPEGETGETMVVTPHVTPHVAPHVKKLLKILVGEMTREDLQAALKLQDRKSFRELYLEPALSAGLIEMTIPDKPKSRNQRYRLTEKGKNVLMEKTNDV
jgi:ATP-dependent DNA helicase RecG